MPNVRTISSRKTLSTHMWHLDKRHKAQRTLILRDGSKCPMPEGRAAAAVTVENKADERLHRNRGQWDRIADEQAKIKGK